MNKRIICFIFTFTLLSVSFSALTAFTVQAQSSTEWSQTYGGAYGDVGRSVCQTSDGGYILFGNTYSSGANVDDFWLVKTDADGNIQWNKTYGGAERDYGHSVQQTSDGGYILFGYTRSYGAGSWDFWLVKTDAMGATQWNQTYGGVGQDSGYSVQQTSDGGYILLGYTDSYGVGDGDFWLVKTDASGNAQWNKTYSETVYAEGRSVQQTSDGGYILLGSLGEDYSEDFWLVKTDADGNAQWNQTYGGSDIDGGHSVQQTSDGGYILLGYTQSYGVGDGDFWLVKTDAMGATQWNQTYGGVGQDCGFSVQQTSDGSYILLGYTASYGSGYEDFWLVRTDADGNAQWNQTCGGANSDQGYSVQQTSDGGYILLGKTGSYGAGITDFWLVKIVETDWPMFRHDLDHTGYSPSTAPNTANLLWNYTTGDDVYSSPAVADGKVYVGSDDHKVYCLNASTGNPLWNYTTGDFVYHSSPAVVDGRVYVGSYDDKLYCLNASTGNPLWNYTTWGDVSSSPAVVDGKVYVGSWDNKVYCLNASTGNPLWSYTTGGGVSSSPAVVDDWVYIGSDDHKVYCFNASTGNPLWNYTTGGWVRSSPAVVDGKVYVGSWDNKVYCLNASTGNPLWSYTTGYLVYHSSPAVADGKVYIGSDDGKVYCLNASTGTKIWNYTTGGGVDSSPAVADGKVYVGSSDNKVYCLNASTGNPLWSYITGGGVYSSPAVADGKVYVGSCDDKVYAFGDVSSNVPVISNFTVTPNSTVNPSNPATISANVSDSDGDLYIVYFMVTDASNLTAPNEVILWEYMDYNGTNKMYSTQWNAKTAKLGNDTVWEYPITLRTFESVGYRYYFAYGFFDENGDGVKDTTGYLLYNASLALIAIQNMSAVNITLQDGVTTFTVQNYEWATSQTINGTTFTLYSDLTSPGNPQMVLVEVPNGSYSAYMCGADGYGTANDNWNTTAAASVGKGYGQIQMTSYWKIDNVTFDGNQTSFREWSDVNPVDLFLNPWPNTTLPPFNGTVWVKNDETWLYILFKIPFPIGENDGAYFNTHYQGTDPNTVDGGTPPDDYGGVWYYSGAFYPWDGHYTGTGQNVVNANDGTQNVNGTGSYDGTYCWFEYRKMLNSSDGADMVANPGDTIGISMIFRDFDPVSNTTQYYMSPAISLNLSSSWARLNFDRNFMVSTQTDRVSNDTYTRNVRYEFNVYKYPMEAPSLTVYPVSWGLVFDVTSENITQLYSDYEKYAVWNETSAHWDFPSDITISDDQWFSTGFYVNHSQTKYLSMDVARWTNQSVFTSPGYQLARFNVTFQDENFLSSWAHIETRSQLANVTIIPNTFNTDAPGSIERQEPSRIWYTFNRTAMQTGVTYNFTAVLYVDPAGQQVTYKPWFRTAQVTQSTSTTDKGQVASLPPILLPEHVFYASVTTNGSNLWNIYQIDHTYATLEPPSAEEQNVTVFLPLRAGWNMVSLPVTPDNASAYAVLNGTDFLQMVTWNSAEKKYVESSVFEAGSGYWVLVTSDANVSVTGQLLTSVSLNLPSGWSMVGGPNSSVGADGVFPGFYQLATWDQTSKGYISSAAFESGKGYWVLVLTGTTVDVP